MRGLREPVRLGPLTLANRLVFGAHLTNFADEGRFTRRHADYYAARAAGGAGLVITEELVVHRGDRPYEKMVEGWRADALPGCRLVTDAVHAAGAVVFAQLNHNGAQSSGRYTRLPVWAPSAVPDHHFREVPHAVSTGEIAELVAGYASAAARAVAGGFDGVEVQCSQSSIIRQFLVPATNLRGDRYGGQLADRVRFLLEVLDAVRAAIGGNRVLGVRLGLDDRAGLADLVEVARLVSERVDYLNTAVGVAGVSQHLITPPMGEPAELALRAARALRSATDLPVIGVGRFTDLAAAERALRRGDCDLVGVVRAQVADPEFGSRAGTRCLGCNQECVGRVGLNRPLACVVNPRAGREQVAVPTPGARRRVLVVGAGPGGLAAAAGAAERGHRVDCLERRAEVGGQLAVAALGPRRGTLGHLVEDLAGRCARAGAAVHTGVTVDAAMVQAYAPDVVVLATGARARRPEWALGQPKAVDPADVLAGRASPAGRVLVVDELGSHAATSVAELLASRGHQVEIVTPALLLAQGLWSTLDRPAFLRRAHELGISVGAEQVVLAADPDPATGGLRLRVLHHLTDEIGERIVDWVVYAVPGEPVDELWHALRGAATEVHRIGDCVAPRRADAAVREADQVVSSLPAVGMSEVIR